MVIRSDHREDSVEVSSEQKIQNGVDNLERSMTSINVTSGPTEVDVRKVCFWMMVMSAMLIALVLIISHFEGSNLASKENPSQSIAGWVAVVGAAIVFGSTGVPMKSPALVVLEIDSFVFAMYTSLGIFFVSIPLIIYLLAISEFQFKPWAIFGAMDIVIIGYLAFMAVQILGYCKAPAIWAGVGMTCAFLWGALAFKEPINNIPMAVSAILLLVIGVYAVSTSQGKLEKEKETTGGEEDTGVVKNEDQDESVEEEESKEGGVHGSITSEWGEEEKGNMIIVGSDDDYQNIQANPLWGRSYEQRNSMEYNDNGNINKDKNNGNDITDDNSDKNDDDNNNNNNFNCIIDNSSNSNNNYTHDNNNNNNNNNYNANNNIDNNNINNDNDNNNDVIDIDHSNSNDERKKKNSQHVAETSRAYLLCVSVGLCDGALLVPFKLSTYGNTQNNGIFEVFRYLASFGISSILVSPILFFFYCFFLNKRRVPCFHFRTAFLPGVSSGVLWAAANFLSVHATYYLGIKIGFPLTQTCVLVAALWGLLYFKEFDLRKSGYLPRFSSGIFLILCGAYLLGSSG